VRLNIAWAGFSGDLGFLLGKEQPVRPKTNSGCGVEASGNHRWH